MTASLAEVDFPARLGQYRVIRELGRGGMARVFEAEHIHLKKRVALKVLHPQSRGDRASEARFLREGRVAARVRHLHVVEVFDVGVEDGIPFLVMELLDGQTLADLLRAREVLPVQTVAQIFLPIISAVAAAHDLGLVHRDLKPSNVMLTLQGGAALHPVVLDFGISTIADEDETLTVSNTVLGTLQYLAPEQAHGAKFSSSRSDQYSLGVMLYEAVTGQRPFNADSQYNLMHAIVTADARPVEELNPAVPAGLAAVIRRAMRRSPELRFETVRDMGRALLPFAKPVDRARWAPELERSGDTPTAETAVSVEALTALPPTAQGTWLSPLRRLAVAATLTVAGLGTATALWGWTSSKAPSVAPPQTAALPQPQAAAPPLAPAAAPTPAPASSVTPAAATPLPVAKPVSPPAPRLPPRSTPRSAPPAPAAATTPPARSSRERGTNGAAIIE